MFFEVFRKYFVLFFCLPLVTFGQSADNAVTIELSSTNFSIERPFIITVLIPNSESRPSIAFPDIVGFVKKGTSASVTTTEVGGKAVITQIITQSYQARAPGRFRLPPFSITVNGATARSEGAELIVRSLATQPNSATVTPDDISIPKNPAFLSLRATKSSIYAGESVGLTLSFFVADAYPDVLNFTALDKQLQTIVKQIRPANAWEENLNITELKAVPVQIGGKPFREYKLYEAVFFPLSNRLLRLPAVTLQLTRSRPVIGPPTATPEIASFTSQPVSITIRSLPPHPLRGRVPVGVFRLEESLDRRRITANQSVRYAFSVVGEGNIAALPAPAMSNTDSELDVFPPETRQVLNRTVAGVTGRKTFTYFLVPHQQSPIPLTGRFEWIYFNPRTGRYDTLQPATVLRVGNLNATTNLANAGNASNIGADTTVTSTGSSGSIYDGIETLDSRRQPVSMAVLVRAAANVFIVLMLLGMIFVFFKR